jgi:hypothetical protein
MMINQWIYFGYIATPRFHKLLDILFRIFLGMAWDAG